MKKIILLVFITLMFSNIGFAEMKLIETKLILNKDDRGEHHDLRISTYCIDGYKFVEYKNLRSVVANMVQFFEERDGKSLPAKCWK